MATITITVGSVTVSRDIPDDRLTTILELAYEPDATWTLRRRLNHGLDAMWEATRLTARRNRTQQLKRDAEQQAAEEINQ